MVSRSEGCGPAVVIRLTTEALSTKTKDLQLAAWLTRLSWRQDGIGGLREGIGLLHGMIGHFGTRLPRTRRWGHGTEGCCPYWVGSYLGEQVREPL